MNLSALRQATDTKVSILEHLNKLLAIILCAPSTYSTNNNIFVNEYEYIVEVQRRLENTCMLLHFFNSIYVLLETFFESFYVSDSVFSGFSNVSYCSQCSTCTSV